MKKLALILASIILAMNLHAEQKVPDYQISITTNGLYNITLSTSNRLSDLVTWMDNNIVLATNLASRASTNYVAYAITNMFAPYFTTNSTGVPTNQTPRFIGDSYVLSSPAPNSVTTNMIYSSMGTSTSTWVIIYRAP